MVSYRDLPQFTRSAYYAVDSSWRYFKEHVQNDWIPKLNLQLEPDFQRNHVWDTARRIAYIEFILKGGQGAKDIYLNHPHWMSFKTDKDGKFLGEFVLVDGLQRVTSVFMYLDNELPIFGGYYAKDFTDSLPSEAAFKVHVNNLATRAEVLQWYIDLNAGGVAHTEEEIERVKTLLDKENS